MSLIACQRVRYLNTLFFKKKKASRLLDAFPKALRKFSRAWQTPDSPILPCAVLTTCTICGKMIAHKGIGAHCAHVPAQYRLARMFCTDDGVCPACHVQFTSRLRCKHHFRHSTVACLTALAAGHCEPLPHAEVTRLDLFDAKGRNCSRKVGRSDLADDDCAVAYAPVSSRVAPTSVVAIDGGSSSVSSDAEIVCQG